MKVVHRPILSEFIHTVAHDYRSSLLPPTKAEVEEISKEDRVRERVKLCNAKADYLKHKGTAAHNEQRNEFIKAFLGARMPKWGSVRLTPTLK